MAWFKMTGAPYWKLYPKEGPVKKNYVMESSQESEASHGSASDLLNRCLDLLARGEFMLCTSAKPGKFDGGGGYPFTTIEIDQSSHLNSAVGVSGIPVISAQEIEEKIRAGIDAYKKEVEDKALREELRELRLENKKLSKDLGDPMNKVIGMLSPYADKLLPKMLGLEGQQIAGIPQAKIVKMEDETETLAPEEVETEAEQSSEESEEISEEQEKIIGEFIETISEADPDGWIDVIERMTAAVKENPKILQTVKKFI